MKVEMEVQLLQPWSTFVMKTQLPPPILEKMTKISDEAVENRGGIGYNPGAGQLEDQFHVDLEILNGELEDFFGGVCRNYIIQAYFQNEPFNKENILKEEWMTKLTALWINSQKDNEFFPIHVHANCELSATMYLKIPEYLVDRRGDGGPNLDGAVTFTNSASKDPIWGVPSITIQPEVGDLFVFPASQSHQVYPFRTADGKGERRSVSFNARFTNKSIQESIQRMKQQQETI